jgi:hypothetical protein
MVSGFVGMLRARYLGFCLYGFAGALEFEFFLRSLRKDASA